MQFSSIIFNALLNNWDSYCICDAESRSITYGEFGNKLLALHQFLYSNNVHQGDKIILLAPNSINWCVVYLAVITFGAVIVPISLDLPSEHICNLIRHSEAKIAFVSESAKTKVVEHLVPTFSLADETIYSVSTIVGKDSFSIPEVANEHLSIINYTSGTSGQPKGVMLNLVPIVENLKFAYHSFPLREGDHIVSTMPFTHSFGSLYEFLYPFSIGVTIYLLQKKPSPQIIKDVFNEVHPKMFFSVPLVVEKIFQAAIANIQDIGSLDLSNEEEKAKYRNSFMQYFTPECEAIVIGGAKLNPTVEDALNRLQIPFSCGYGMTECGPVISWNNPAKAKAYSVGQLVDGMHSKIINAHSGIGEILLKGANIMLGYFKNEQATTEAIDEEGWLHTGDLGYIDDDGYIFLKGRKKNVILRNDGINIYVDDIEYTIKRNYPQIEDCVVFERGQKIIVKIVLSAECTNLSELLNNINKCLPKYASISQIEIETCPIRRNSKNEILRETYK